MLLPLLHSCGSQVKQGHGGLAATRIKCVGVSVLDDGFARCVEGCRMEIATGSVRPDDHCSV